MLRKTPARRTKPCNRAALAFERAAALRTETAPTFERAELLVGVMPRLALRGMKAAVIKFYQLHFI